MHKKLIVAAAIWFGLGQVVPQIVLAQTPTVDTPVSSPSPTLNSTMSLTLSPVSLSLESDPGVPVTTTIRIRNNSELPEQLSVSFGSFTADESGERPQLLDPAPGQEFLTWMTANPGSFTANPGEWTSVELTFSPPPDAALGYYYAVYISRSEIVQRPGETTVEGSPAILVLTNVRSPNAKRQLELSDFQVERSISEYLPQTFKVTVKNTGNIHVVPSGNIFIDSQGQKDLAVLSLNPTAATILPQSSRTFDVTWIDGFPFRYTTDMESTLESGFQFASLQWDLTKANTFRIGPYTGHLLMVYDNGERDVPIESFVSFWILPWKLMLGALLIILLTLIGLSSILKNVWKKIRSLTHAAS